MFMYSWSFSTQKKNVLCKIMIGDVDTGHEHCNVFIVFVQEIWKSNCQIFDVRICTDIYVCVCSMYMYMYAVVKVWLPQQVSLDFLSFMYL